MRDRDTAMSTEAEREQFWHSPSAPNMSRWPFDVPWIMGKVQRAGLTVVTAGTLEAIERELSDMTEWCRTAEYRVRSAMKA